MSTARAPQPIGMGTFEMGGGNLPYKNGQAMGTPYRDASRDEECVKALVHSLRLGQWFIDTAEMYSNGGAEELVGRALAEAGSSRDSLYLCSKVRRETMQDPASMLVRVQQMCQRIGVLESGGLDALYLHSPNYEGTDMADYVPAICLMQDMGLTQAIGVSNFNLEQLQRAQQLSWHPIRLIQNFYNPLYKHAGGNKATFTPELQAYCRDQDITMVAHTPLHAGKVAHHPVLQAIAAELGITAAQLTLAWTLGHGILPIPKACTRAHIDENVAAQLIQLPDDVMAAIDQLPSEALTARNVTVTAAIAS